MFKVDPYRTQLYTLCQKHNVRSLYLFGSASTPSFNDTSDIDLLVQFNPIDKSGYFSNYMNFKSELEALFHRQVDLVENQAIRNPVFRRVVDRERTLLFKQELLITQK